MQIAIGTYINFRLFTGANTGYAFQNFHAGATRSYGGISYIYAGFGFSGTSVDLQGSAIEAQLVFAVSSLLMTFIQQAADERWILRVRTVWLDPDTLVETSTYMEEVYQVHAFQHNGSRLSLKLGSPLDAVASHVPKRTLRQGLVGALPSSGQINFS
jgi:hypothetical protein